MNKKFLILAGAAEALLAVVFGALLAHATMSASRLKGRLADARRALEAARQAKATVEAFESERETLARQEQEFWRRIPANEKEPLSLLKQLTLWAGETRLSGLSFSIRPKQPVEASGAPAGPQEPSASGAFSQGAYEPGGMTAATADEDQPDQLSRFPIQMEFQSEFRNLLLFLSGLRALDRLTTVESLTITRSKDAIPRQAVALALNAYTYPSP